MQLIVSKSILPWFGGSAAVWTTSMLVFQALLLAGYIYSHVISFGLGDWAGSDSLCAAVDGIPDRAGAVLAVASASRREHPGSRNREAIRRVR